jgi:hypothetical protein
VNDRRSLMLVAEQLRTDLLAENELMAAACVWEAIQELRQSDRERGEEE